MADAQDKVKEKIDEAAGAGKAATDKVAGETKAGAAKAGGAVKDVGEKIKDAAD